MFEEGACGEEVEGEGEEVEDEEDAEFDSAWIGHKAMK